MSHGLNSDTIDSRLTSTAGQPFGTCGGNLDRILFSFLHDHTSDVVFVLEVTPDGQYRFISVNARFQETTGLPASAVVGKRVDEVIPAASLALVKSKYREAIETRQCVRWDEVSEYPTGTKVGEVAVTPVYGPDGGCTALVGMVHDVTERHQALARISELEERWRMALSAAGAAAWDWDRQANLLKLSEHWKTLLGIDTERLTPDSALAERFLHADDYPAVVSTLKEIVAGTRTTFTLEARLRHLYGHWVWVRCQGTAVRARCGELQRILGTASNMSPAKAAEQALQLAALVFQHSSEAIAVCDTSGCILTVNPTFIRMRGYNEGEIIGQTAHYYNAQANEPDFYERVWTQVRSTGQWKGEVWSRHKDGHVIAESRSVNAVTGPDGAVCNYIEIATDITEKKRAEEMLWRQANYDSLTALPNRHLFMDRLRQAVKGTHRGSPGFAVLYIDLDHFKEVNDTLGHSVGDCLLKEAAQRLLRCTRDTDTVCRLGGDEFTVLLASIADAGSTDWQAADRIAQSILHLLSEPFRIGDETLHISASIGITRFPKDAHDVESLMKHADQAMYEAKRQGRNRYAYFSHDLQEKAQHRRRMVADLRSAIQNEALQVYYQPVVDLQSGRMVKAEALLRWHHPAYGWISPAEFIPLCEETKFIVEVGEWTFRQVVSDAARWLRYCKGLQFAVNMSPSQIIHGGESCNRCIAFLAAHALPPNAIVVEVTETSLLQKSHVVEEQLRQFSDHGICLALDDFGTGYSALSYLQQYDFQYLKIDRSFVRNAAPGTIRLALCETIILMAHRLGMRVIAEGMESEHEAALLRDAGCDFGQGYYFFQPLPAPAFEELLTTHADAISC